MEANDEFTIQKAKITSYNSWSDAMKLSLKFHCHIYGQREAQSILNVLFGMTSDSTQEI